MASVQQFIGDVLAELKVFWEWGRLNGTVPNASVVAVATLETIWGTKQKSVSGRRSRSPPNPKWFWLEPYQPLLKNIIKISPFLSIILWNVSFFVSSLHLHTLDLYIPPEIWLEHKSVQHNSAHVLAFVDDGSSLTVKTLKTCSCS